MNVKKIALCLCAVTLSTQLAAKDLAEEKEIVCMVRTDLAVSVNSKIKNAGGKYDDAQRDVLVAQGMKWAIAAEGKYLTKLKVAQSTFDSAANRVGESENELLEKHLYTLDLTAGETAIRNEIFKFRLNRMKPLGCLGNVSPSLYQVSN